MKWMNRISAAVVALGTTVYFLDLFWWTRAIKAALKSVSAAALPALVVLAAALPSHALTQLAVGWGSSTLDKNGDFEEVTEDQVVLKLEEQFALAPGVWAGLALSYGAKTESVGMGIRSYFGDDASATYLGVGIFAQRWDEGDFDALLADDTMLLGPEVLLEALLPEGLPAVGGRRGLAYIRYLTRVQGDPGTSQLDFGVDVKIDLGT